MMHKSKKLIEECYNFEFMELSQWKIDLIQPQTDTFNLGKREPALDLDIDMDQILNSIKRRGRTFDPPKRLQTTILFEEVNLDEQVMVSQSKALALICTWILKMIDSFKAHHSFKKEKETYEGMTKEYNVKNNTKD